MKGSSSSRLNRRIEDSIERFARQRLYPPKLITLGLSGIVREEERLGASSMCGLSSAECRHYQEQVSTAMN
jgi:hypothetical protein